MTRRSVRNGNRSIAGILRLSTAIAAVLGVSGNAWAGCTPNPAQASGTTICSGQETARLTVALDGAAVLIDKDATLTAASPSSILVTTTASPSGLYTNANKTLTINGAVTNDNGSGILVTTGPATNNPNNYYGANRTTITVGETGRVSGPVGIDVTVDGGNARNDVVLVNNGTISSSTGGYALRGSADAMGRFESITNSKIGVIGAISGQVGTLTNEGLIDGGTRSAYADAAGYLQYYGQGVVSNSDRQLYPVAG